MNKKVLLITITSILLLFLTIYLFTIKYLKLLPVTITITILVIIYNIYIIISRKNNSENYEKKLNSILNTYESIIVKTNKKYNLKSNKVLHTPSIDNLLKAQKIINKPINYSIENKKNLFILQDSEYLLVYILQ